MNFSKAGGSKLLVCDESKKGTPVTVTEANWRKVKVSKVSE